MNTFADFKEIMFYSDADSRERKCVRGPQGDADWGMTVHSKDSPTTISISGFSGIKVGQTFRLTGGTTGIFVVLRDDGRRGWKLCREHVNEERIAQERDARVCDEYYARQRAEGGNPTPICMDGRHYDKAAIQLAVARHSKRLWAERQKKIAPNVVFGPIDDPDFA